jgi:multiple sugar transport system substrate-binding protein
MSSIRRITHDDFDRRTLLRTAALGSAGFWLAACQQDSEASSPERSLTPLLSNWIVDLYPTILGATDPGLRVDSRVAPPEGIDVARFVRQARRRRSTWDVYVGLTPFADLVRLVEGGAIEAWDPYLGSAAQGDILPAVRAECTLDGALYSWPFLLDVVVQAWNAELVERAELDPTQAPRTWDEYLGRARTVVERGAAPFGCTFDPRGWRSLVPVAYSISPDVYTDDGLVDLTHEAVVEALQILRRMKELAPPDALDPRTSIGAGIAPDERAFAAGIVAYWIKYQNAPVRFSGAWPDPGRLELGWLPAGSEKPATSLFWTTGIALLRHGRKKKAAARYAQQVTHSERVWRLALAAQGGSGHLPPYTSTWERLRAAPPDWLARWAIPIVDQLSDARPIRPHRLGAGQLEVGRRHWEQYLLGEERDPARALRRAMDAVRKRVPA